MQYGTYLRRKALRNALFVAFPIRNRCLGIWIAYKNFYWSLAIFVIALEVAFLLGYFKAKFK